MAAIANLAAKRQRPGSAPGYSTAVPAARSSSWEALLRHESTRVTWTLFSAIALLIILVWLAPFFSHWLVETVKERGAVVDPSLQALFSGLAFAGVILAIFLQQQELALQRRELADTREVIEGQRKQLEAQSQTLQKQNFEDTFFRMLELHNDIVGQMTDAISLPGGPELMRTGRDCFAGLYRFELKGAYQYATERSSSTVDFFDTMWGEFFKDNGWRVGHYFRHLYHIVRFVSESDRPDKQFYTNLVRAQLSTYELALLFYNCLAPVGRRRFKGLVEKYALLENLPTAILPTEDVLLDPSHRSLYEPGAFQEST